MRRVLIATHHRMAQGIADTLAFVTGGAVEAQAICAYVTDEPLEDQLARALSAIEPDDEALVLTDMLQGSVNQAVAACRRRGMFVVTGVNLPVALELSLSPEPLTDEAVERIVRAAREQLMLVPVPSADMVDGDE